MEQKPAGISSTQLDEWLAELYDLSSRWHALLQLNNDMERILPQCHAKDMMRGKLRKHVRQLAEEMEVKFHDLANRFGDEK